MKTITKTIELYTFSELSEDSQLKATNNLISEWLEYGAPSGAVWTEETLSNFNRAIDDAEKMQTPWFAGEYVLDYCRNDIYAELNSAYFTADGNWYAFIDMFDEVEA